jgi:NADH dehydrogenase (ubiquinone) flavoprotein 2
MSMLSRGMVSSLFRTTAASSSSRVTARAVASLSAFTTTTTASAATTTRNLLSSSTSNSGSRFFSGGIVQHRDTPTNHKDMPFKFTAESEEKIKYHLSKYPSNYQQSAVMPLLYLAQEQNNNHLTLAAMNHIAERLNMPAIRVYEVATFFTMYNRTPVGKYHIQLCGTTMCMICGAKDIKKAIMDWANIEEGGTSADGLITLTEVECLGACTNAPMIQVNNEFVYENLNATTMVAMMESWKAGKEVPRGPQNGQHNCEGPKGQTNLKGEQMKGVCRDLDELKANIEAEAKEASKAAPAAKK